MEADSEKTLMIPCLKMRVTCCFWKKPYGTLRVDDEGDLSESYQSIAMDQVFFLLHVFGS